jgi:hypothetical protein
MYIGFHVKYPLFLSDFNEIWISSPDFQKFWNIKFHENPSVASRVVPCGQTDGRTDMTKLIVAFHSFANAPKMPGALPSFLIHCLVTCIIDPRRDIPFLSWKWDIHCCNCHSSVPIKLLPFLYVQHEAEAKNLLIFAGPLRLSTSQRAFVWDSSITR